MCNDALYSFRDRPQMSGENLHIKDLKLWTNKYHEYNTAVFDSNSK